MPNALVSRATLIGCVCAQLDQLAAAPRWTAEIVERMYDLYMGAPYEGRVDYFERALFGAPPVPAAAAMDMRVAVAMISVLIDSGALD